MPSSTLSPIYVGGQWRASSARRSFSAVDPQTGHPLEPLFPVSDWSDCELALAAAESAALELRETPASAIADFLEAYATALEHSAESLVAAAHRETALPIQPRLQNVELPRTTGQLRQAAAAAREGSWALPVLDTANNIRSYYAALGPVFVLGPNNFPLAFNAASGGDFAAAIAAGNPVIAKAHPSHPHTTRLLFEAGVKALQQSSLPASTMQLLYHLDPDDGLRMIADRRLAAVAFTGSRHAGLALKAAADAAGKPSYLEMSSVNPVVILPAALAERREEVVEQFCGSCTLAAGQFCTNPGLLVLLDSPTAQEFIETVVAKLQALPAGTLFAAGVREALAVNVARVAAAGAQLRCGGHSVPGPRFAFENTLLTVAAAEFLAQPAVFQTEMFGTATLVVLARDPAELEAVLTRLEGNLTGTIYTGKSPNVETSLYRQVARALRPRVGRLLENKMPTGVAVSPAMHHGGPFPATGHPGFTAVGIPASLRRFAMLQCFDSVAPQHLPAALQDPNPNGQLWRQIDGRWTQHDAT